MNVHVHGGRWLLAAALVGSFGCGFEERHAHSADPAAPPAAAAPAEKSGTAASGNASGQRPANRLAAESSPYLLLHAHNPVDWHPWGPEAFEIARRENKPIFLSIGYSSCFWCHVMERQVFENEEIARYMNEHFVNIKVDREERPDLDDIYMTAVQVYFQAVGSNQGGGWPLSMFLTPTGKPFAGGTYFPPEDMPGRPGFPGVMRTVTKLWTERQKEIEASAEVIAGEVRRIMKPSVNLKSIPLDRSLVDAAVEAVLKQYDPVHGGLDFRPQQPDTPKFPVPSRLMLLQAQAGRPHSKEALQAVDHTLEAMAAGGMYDHLAGGFHRYSTDRQWRVPHFEKMLYDNAQLAEVYANAYQRTSRQPYRQTSEETIDFVLREMTGPQGGFHSALDAETDGVEGAYYVWSREELKQVLGNEDAEVFMSAYGADQPEFFEHGYVLYLPRPLGDTAEALEMSAEDLRSRLADMRKKLLAVREKRKPLLEDDKVLTSWNGLMIRSLARAGAVLGRPEYLQAAEKGAVFLAAELRDAEGRLQRTWRGGESKLNAYLDDYAFLIEGLLALHEATGDEKWLHAARRLMDDQIALFWDPQGKGFFFTSHRHEELLARAKDGYDSVLPSGNSVTVRNLVRMAKLTEDERYRQYAAETLQVFAPALQQSPGSMPYMALALQDYIDAFGGASPARQPAESLASSPPATPANTPSEQRPMPQQPPQENSKLQPLVEQPEDLSGKHKARATAYLATDKLKPGAENPIAIAIAIEEGWHLNSNPPRPDFVIPTEVSATGALGSALDSVQYPEGHEFRVEGIDEPLSVYEKQVVLRGVLKVPAAAAGKAEKLTLTIRYQACNDQTCTRPLEIELSADAPVAPIGENLQSINQRLFSDARQ
jgi:uncharacterized protein YyaL (SSP411 family)